jgi:glutamyl-tRNA synthetase
MTVVTRFAPSPTGFLHIGGARTALFNWLYARHHGGAYLLRIEDTDRKRSTKEAIDAILDGLHWLGLDPDGEVVYQSANIARHVEVAQELLDAGKAYYCYCSPEELTAMREEARASGNPMRYDGRWRDRDPTEAPPGVDPVIRFKAPQGGATVIEDLVQGTITNANKHLDDMVLLRADGTPTYMLGVVVDDHEMGVTHAIRGDDHLSNAYRQTQLYLSLGWEPPAFGHIPLIHGFDGGKLSKRHGALGVETYREMGYLPEALRNYLLRLGWGHGNDEIISTEQAIQWFDLDAVVRSPAKFDFAKLSNLNGHYLRQTEDSSLVELILPHLEKALGQELDEAVKSRLERGMSGLKERVKMINELTRNAIFYVISRPVPMDKTATAILDDGGRQKVADILPLLSATEGWEAQALEELVRTHAEEIGAKLGQIAQPLRAALTGSKTSPPIFEVMDVLGREESLNRLSDVSK